MAVVAGAALSLVLGVNAAPTRRATASARVKRPVPESLQTVESSAEDLVDLALAGQRDRVEATAAALKVAANGSVISALLSAGTPSPQIAALKDRARRVMQLARAGSFVQVALAANSVSQLMGDLYGRFTDPVPPVVRTLDYLDREAQLRSLAGERERVRSAVAELQRAWQRLQPKVVARGGTREAAAYKAHVAAMRRLAAVRSWRLLESEAVNGLNLVDSLETVFSR
jgi:hypothetical protein